ncbi:MAG: hypothetical protein A2015_04405 [Spirochaetes bacterium GWF1_31_7]|nr:MAG: hypothetical protein A2Y30_16865 [Spirochaetes bacterium GWE1_32_154]OHD52594.1 MAG: hypothetical protein A2Y29_00085 [Spirochaetes bacterium GWE2_31_10]OHD52962.1 MAG: hypothetical protein A2015_04405 [Spirochaetes bacterium GWF1_31_7]HBD93706.1 hypothetical protein [Spirochaetia bacterium]HBI37210.1 hypothetical protein [Spirochaetia bacterium]
MKLLKLLTLGFSLIVITSCFSQRITLNPDKKSGNVSINYTFSDDDFEILSLILSSAPVGGEAGTFDPSILIDKKEFISYFQKMEVKELTLVKSDISRKVIDGVGYYTGAIVINFTDFEILLNKFPASENGLGFKREGQVITMEQKIEMGKMGDMETLDNYIDLVKADKPVWYKKFINDDFLIEIVLKKPFIQTRGVTLSSDKKTAKYSFKTADMIGSNRKDLDFMLKF